MKLYKIKEGIVIESENSYRVLANQDWDTFVNDDHLYKKLLQLSTQ